MAFEKHEEFTDWLYNRFVEASRKEHSTKALVFLDVLREYNEQILQGRKYSRQRRHATKLIKAISTCIEGNTVAELLPTGRDGQQELDKAIKYYEQS